MERPLLDDDTRLIADAPRPLILLFLDDTKRDAGLHLELALEHIFGGTSTQRTFVDLATVSDKDARALESVWKRRLADGGITNVVIRWSRHRKRHTQRLLNQLYTNSRCLRLKVVVHFAEFVPGDSGSLAPNGVVNADWILVHGRGWDPRLFQAAGIPQEDVEASTCDLVGVTLTPPTYTCGFVEIRVGDDPEARRRARARCAQICEELMRVVWHPDRVRARLNACECFDGLDAM
jgi:hypothetical protein